MNSTAMPVLGETIEVANLWSAAAVWIKEGPGIAQLVAEWMTYGYPHLCDPHSSDISRMYPHERTEHLWDEPPDGPVTFDRGDELTPTYAIRSGENGFFTVADADSLYRTMRVASARVIRAIPASGSSWP